MHTLSSDNPDPGPRDELVTILAEAEAQHEGDENWGLPHLIVEIDQH